jgi:hypothetical protein
MYFRNLTISLFQGYQITDTLVTEQQPDPENPGQNLPVAVDSKKSVYLNKVWGNRISEAYRDCFVSRTATAMKFGTSASPSSRLTLNGGVSAPSYFQDIQVSDYVDPNRGVLIIPRKYNTTTGQWTNESLFSEFSKTIYNGYLVNQSMINLIDDINAKGALGQFSILANLVKLNDAADQMGKNAQSIMGLENSSMMIEEEIQKSVAVMGKTADIISEIASLSVHNADKVGDITAKLSKINDAAHINARSVEEIAASIEHLNSMSEALGQKLKRFET